MKINNYTLHSFRVTPKDAVRIQQELRDKVILKGKITKVLYVAAADVSFGNGRATAAIVVVRMPDIQRCDFAVASRAIEFPYIPGLLSFREIPVVLDALRKITTVPDVVLCDGQGIAHPRRLGIAAHLGVVTGLRTIGVAKSRLIGTHGVVPVRKGESTPLFDKNEIIGAVVCTRDNVKPLYVSSGHRVDLASAVDMVMRCVTRYRLPEPIRMAHRLAGESRK